MNSIRLGMLGVFAAGCILAQLPDLSPVAGEVRIAPHQRYPIRDKVDHFDGTSDSTNWSGYAVLGSGFTLAKGSWVVPAMQCSGVTGAEYAAEWVGIDGYNSNTVEQTGTESDCNGSTPSYYAWYEFYPHFAYEILSVPVAAGNIISALVTSSGDKFTVTIVNESTGKSFSYTSSVHNAQRSSAEWIVEAPCCTKGGGILPLAPFGTAFFGGDSTGQSGTNDAIDTAFTGAIGVFGANTEEINKVGSSTSPQTSTCSALSSDGTSFSCTWGSH